jgi:hypothetical protein
MYLETYEAENRESRSGVKVLNVQHLHLVRISCGVEMSLFHHSMLSLAERDNEIGHLPRPSMCINKTSHCASLGGFGDEKSLFRMVV